LKGHIIRSKGVISDIDGFGYFTPFNPGYELTVTFKEKGDLKGIS